MNDERNLEVRNWYMETFPTDELGNEIWEHITFNEIFSILHRRDTIYRLLAGDSVIRERVFAKLADVMNVSYDDIYNKWIGIDRN